MANPQRKIPAPSPTPEAVAFFEATKSGKFMIKRCTACAKLHWYPRARSARSA